MSPEGFATVRTPSLCGAIDPFIPEAFKPRDIPRLPPDRIYDTNLKVGVMQIMKVSSIGLGSPCNPMLRGPVLGHKTFGSLIVPPEGA